MDCDIIKFLPSNYHYKIEMKQFIKENQFIANFSLEILDAQAFECWRSQFELLNKISLRILTSKKPTETKIFDKFYVCHHNTWKGKQFKGKHTNCPFKMIAKIFSSKIYYAHPCKVKLYYQHNHLIHSKVILRQLRVPKAMDDKLKQLYIGGHTIKSARSIIFDQIRRSINQNEKLEIKLADRSIYPDEAHCRIVYQNLMISKHGGVDNDIETLIKKYLDDSNSKNVSFEHDDENIYIAICTPIMGRIHENLESAGELVFVDSFGEADYDGMKLYIFMTHSYAGGFPLTVGLTNSETEASLIKLFTLIKKVLPHNAFNGRFNIGPFIFMTRDCETEQNALQTVWPESHHILCHFHVMQQMWKWLIDEGNRIEAYHQYHLFSCFRTLVYATSEDDLLEKFENILHDKIYMKYNQFNKYLGSLIERKEKWSLALRPHLQPAGLNRNMFTQNDINVLKSKILEKLRTRSNAQLLDLLLFKFSEFYVIRALDYARGCLKKSKKLPPKFAVAYKYAQLDTNVFEILCAKNNGAAAYHVDCDIRICTCPECLLKSECKHLIYFDSLRGDAPIPSRQKDKELMYYISCGGEYPVDVNFTTAVRTVYDCEQNVTLTDIAQRNNLADDNLFAPEIPSQMVMVEKYYLEKMSVEKCRQLFEDKIELCFENDPSATGIAMRHFSRTIKTLNEADFLLALKQFGKPCDNNNGQKLQSLNENIAQRIHLLSQNKDRKRHLIPENRRPKRHLLPEQAISLRGKMRKECHAEDVTLKYEN